MEQELEKETILIVDDTPENIDLLALILEGEYKIKVATNGEKALKIAFSAKKPDLILLDIMMPGINGYEVCSQLKKEKLTEDIPVIFLTAKSDSQDESKGFEVGAVDYINKPINPITLRARVKTHLALHDQNRALENKVKERTAELVEIQREVLKRLGRAAEYKDNETGLHVTRMSHYSQLISLAMGHSEEEADLLLAASPMHDIGKIGIPDAILLKPSKLNDEEWGIMQRHPTFGASIIGDHNSELLRLAKALALTHHEKWNGTGYPQGLKGKDIPLSGRITSLADVFDALTSKRPYKDEWPIQKAVEYIKVASGSQFDPAVVKGFIKALPEILKIRDKHLEN